MEYVTVGSRLDGPNIYAAHFTPNYSDPFGLATDCNAKNSRAECKSCCHRFRAGTNRRACVNSCNASNFQRKPLRRSPNCRKQPGLRSCLSCCWKTQRAGTNRRRCENGCRAHFWPRIPVRQVICWGVRGVVGHCYLGRALNGTGLID